MDSRRAICTIIAKNYIAQARTLSNSFRAQHPNYDCYVLVVDDFKGFINPADEKFEIIELSDLRLPNPRSLCFKYDLKELCTAVKAVLLDYLLREKKVDRLIYLDPDILVTGSLDAIFDSLGVYDIVLTPHLDRDYPDDGLLPNDGHILRAGLFNLGFIGINASANAREFLGWWKLKLEKNCIVDLLNGYFVDQKFIDFVPMLFKNILIETDTGYNVAYWNLHSRSIKRDNGTWMCNGSPLHFFHFSGYSPPGTLISSHIPSHAARIQLSNRRDIRELFKEYKLLLLANGYEAASSWPYSFDYFSTGERIPYHLRAYYRQMAANGRHRDPFESKKLKRLAGIPSQPGRWRLASRGHVNAANGPTSFYQTSEQRLDAILNSRAWRWITYYGRFKNRFVAPPYDFLKSLVKGRTRAPKQTPDRRASTSDVESA